MIDINTSKQNTSKKSTATKVSSGRMACFLPFLSGGGAERAMIHLAEGFADSGWCVDLVVAQATGAYASQLPAKINLVNLEARSPLLLNKTLALAKYLRSEQPAVLLTTLDIMNATAWAQGLSGVSTHMVMIVQTHLSQQFRDRHSPLVQRLRWQMVKQFYPLADRIVAVSQGVADDITAMTGIPSEQIRVIYNPVVRPNLAERASEPVEHPWFSGSQSMDDQSTDSQSTDGQIPTLLGVGRLVKQKDFGTLIRALAIVRQQRPCRLAILGETDEREADIKPALDRLIADLGLDQSVAFLGFVENPYKYMARAQVFVLSSIYEGFGNVVAEALAVGTSVVSTDCESGPAEILNHGQFGRLAPVGDAEALAKAIVATLDQPLPPEMLRARSQDFTIEASISQYREVITPRLPAVAS